MAIFNRPSALPTRKLRRATSLSGWHAVLNDENSYLETSVAAFMISAMSRAILHSWVEPKA
ncbi:MAG: glycoside hydrolase family 88 protein [Acidobacteriia bacterium]|nr:glycoside hydrolase family 88 protein [Terriglobia bacterium]